VLSEFGGIAVSGSKDTWGYSKAPGEDALAVQYEQLMAAVHSIGLLSGFCYTQFADTYQEANGLLTADRRPKIPLPRLAAATKGRMDTPQPGGLGSASRPDALAPAEPDSVGDVQAVADQA
jgi:hypothetical protein